ncbi:hypothetical protein PROFUN_11741 [Planoprotostelium fungivorum]|uniref:Dephospho-CoA kinase n=1 Tax=Planoprotostelium fungivorum TaxID=1890364 RepID=A0A2P6MYI3_9EUKA|nr:hypothetical protein PROFUN_11741 [Planoprotostelium fungivorum]
MKIIGLTGGIASGKSTVSRYFIECGLAVIDLDVIARQVVDIGKPAYKKIVSVFGTDILSEDGSIDRLALGRKVFKDVQLRRQLNQITHWYILLEVMKQIFLNFIKGEPVVVLDVPLLFETSFSKITSQNIVVWVDADTQFERLRVRDPQLTEEEARDRIASQMSLDKKKKLANYLIDNTGTQEETKDQASHVMRLISPGIVHKIVYLVAIPSFCGLWFLWFVKRLWTWW